jgi:hypothetical protein
MSEARDAIMNPVTAEVTSRRRLPGTRDQRLSLVIVVWTLVVWLPRIWIIPVGNPWELIRIVVSIAVGLGAAFALVRPGRYANFLLLAFSVWSAGVWGRTLWNYWTLDNPPELRLVHTLLAIGYFYLAWRVFRTGRERASNALSVATT